MSYCADKGIPHSKFLSWEPEDRAKVLALLMEQNERCTMCGTAEWEWEENRFAYTPIDTFCRGCYLKSVYGETESEQKALPGTNVKLVPTTLDLKAKLQVTAKKRAQRIAEE